MPPSKTTPAPKFNHKELMLIISQFDLLRRYRITDGFNQDQIITLIAKAEAQLDAALDEEIKNIKNEEYENGRRYKFST